MKLPVQTELAVVQPVELTDAQRIRVAMLRLDLIHPVVSGNKWFKLRRWLEQAKHGGYGGILTAGGPYSNHLVAAAFAAAAFRLPSAAIIGSEPEAAGNPSLQEAAAYGMQLHFISRAAYRQYKSEPLSSGLAPDNWLGIPEGGKGAAGVAGAAGILDLVPDRENYTHLVCAAGTGTMAAGIALAAAAHQQLLVISALKGEGELENSIRQYLPAEKWPQVQVLRTYHFGGYAKHPQALLDYMNQLYRLTEIPTDIVYTGKMMYGLEDLLRQGYLPAESSVLVIHSGGLQGNRSLAAGQLIF